MNHSFRVTYKIRISPGEDLEQKLTDICVEQSVEMPPEVVPEKLAKEVIGKVASYEPIQDRVWLARIDWPLNNTGMEAAQFINILFGNISMKHGIRIIDVEWTALTDFLPGPRFGIEGLRKKWAIPERALSCTALKPMGSSPEDLGRLSYEFAMGGIDIIKDDHGLANQTYARFEERVKACVKAIDSANRQTGQKHFYFPNITGDPYQVLIRYRKAKELGADGVLLIPQICGLPVLARLRDEIDDLPIMAHPAFSGSYIIHPYEGFTPACYYGGLWRNLGADFVIYANEEGRFSFSRKECLSINTYCRETIPGVAACFPTPGGGINRNKMDKWLSLYGKDTVYLIGGSLYKHPDGIRQASLELTSLLISS